MSVFPAKQRRAPGRSTSGFWQVVAILAPLALLALLGVRGLEVSRAHIYADAASQAARALKQAQPAIEEFWNTELSGTSSADPIPLYPMPPVPAPVNEAQAIYKEALQLSGTAPERAMADLSTIIVGRYSDALAESGVPLQPMAMLLGLRLDRRPYSTGGRTVELCFAAVRSHPSILTPALLSAGRKLAEERNSDENVKLFDSFTKQWMQDEQTRAVWRAHAQEIAAAKTPFWIGKEWWVRPSVNSQTTTILSANRVRGLVLSLAKQIEPSLPNFAGFCFSLDGVPVLNPGGDQLASEAAGNGRIDAAVTLAYPDMLLAQQRQQTGWFAALLAIALLAEMTGLFAMQRALRRERQLGQLKSDFVSSVSHELRAPVASIRLMAENLETGAVTAEARRGEYHHLIAEECRRLSALIDNVLDFARIEQNRKSYHFMETDVVALVRDTVAFMEPRAGQRRQRIECDATPIEPPPVCDNLAIRQALINLLDNAIKFAPESTVIRVRLWSSGEGTWSIAVRDDGPGIPAAEHEAIFERFHRLGDELRRETQGAGIGLSIVRHIAEGHDGRVDVASEPGAGAEFTLDLPIMPAAAEEAQE